MKGFANAKISVRQFTILIILGIVGDSILILPTIMAASAKQDAWLSMLLASLLGLMTGGLFTWIATRLNGSSLVVASLKQLGGVIGSLFSVLLIFQFFICCLTLMSEMSQFMTTQLMPETPATAILLFFSAVIIIAYRYGIEAFARMSELLFPVFMVLFVFLIVFLLPEVELSNLFPIAAKGISPIIKGALPAFAYGFTEMLILLMLVPHINSNTKLTKPIMSGFAMGAVLLFVIVLFSVLVLGPNLMETKYYPTFVLAQKINIGDFLERLEAIITFLWVITVFYKTILVFFALTTGISQLFRLKESNMLTIPLGMILLVFTIVSTPNITEYNKMLIENYPWFDIAFCVLLPGLLLVMFYIAGKLKGRSNKTEN